MTRVGHYILGLRRDTLPWLFIIFFLGVILVTGFYVLGPAFRPSTTLQLGDGIFTSSIVPITQSQISNIVNVDPLNPTEAVVLAYDYEQILPISLKARAASVDLVWLDNNKQVVYIVKNISNLTVNQFTPEKPARYIIELAQGTVKNKAIAVGAKAVFHDQRAGGF